MPSSIGGGRRGASSLSLPPEYRLDSQSTRQEQPCASPQGSQPTYASAFPPWWSMRDSNPRLPVSHTDALPTELIDHGWYGRIRTHISLVNSQLPCQSATYHWLARIQSSRPVDPHPIHLRGGYQALRPWNAAVSLGQPPQLLPSLYRVPPPARVHYE